ncbi:Uncharacterised protein [Vibrio cholerae]|nr:Uncharacterised protein [Vibrio cholerae]
MEKRGLFFNHVPHTSYIFNQIIRQFFAQIMNMYFDCVITAAFIPAVQCLLQKLFTHHSSRLGHQTGEDFVLISR